MIPVSYTEDTFADYLRFEVLGEVATVMDWFTPTVQAPTTLGTLTLDANANVNQAYVDFTTTPEDFGIGTEITFAGDTQVYRVAEVGFKDANAIKIRARIFPYLKLAKTAGGTATYSKLLRVKEVDPAYRYITNETLSLLGMTNISEANTEQEIIKLRMVGRIEAWRAVMCNSATMSSSETQEGNWFNRAEVFFNARDQLAFAEQEYGRFFGLSVPNNPEFYTTTNTVVKGAW